MRVQAGTSRKGVRRNRGISRRPTVASVTKRDKEEVLRGLHLYFPIKDLGKSLHYIGYHTTRDDQYQYVQVVVERFGMAKTTVGGKARTTDRRRIR